MVDRLRAHLGRMLELELQSSYVGAATLLIMGFLLGAVCTFAFIFIVQRLGWDSITQMMAGVL